MTVLAVESPHLRTEALAQKAAASKLGRSWCLNVDHLTYPISLHDNHLTVGAQQHPTDASANQAYERALRFHAHVQHITVVPMQSDEITRKLRELFGDPPPARSQSETVGYWHEILHAARDYNAANIFLEPEQEGGVVRLDVDGDAEEHFRFDFDSYEKLVTYICQGVPNFNPNVGQRGKVQLSLDGSDMNCRIGTFPIWNPHGPVRTKIALRVLKPYELLPSLSGLGMRPDQVRAFMDIIAHPNACVLNGAPTGHGKSTSIYAALKTLPLATMNVYAIENPPELAVPGISQSQVFEELADDDSPAWTYYKALVELLRQDPKFVFLGECLEKLVARRFIEASDTGIPFATTLHTYDALAIIERLRAFDIPNDMIARTITALLSQRLVKHLCKECRVPARLSEQVVLDASRYGLAIQNAGVFARNPEGCEFCYQRGTFQRSGVFEMLSITPDIRRKIRAGEPADDILMYLRAEPHDDRQSFVSMFERALVLLLDGTIDEQELYRRFASPQMVLSPVPKTHPFRQDFERGLEHATAALAQRIGGVA